MNLKFAQFYPDETSTKAKSKRLTMGFHFLVGFDVGLKVEEVVTKGRTIEEALLPTLGFSIGL